MRVVDHCRVGYNLLLRPAHLHILNLSSLNAKPFGSLGSQDYTAEIFARYWFDFSGFDIPFTRTRRTYLGAGRELEADDNQYRNHPSITVPHRAPYLLP